MSKPVNTKSLVSSMCTFIENCAPFVATTTELLKITLVHKGINKQTANLALSISVTASRSHREGNLS